MMNKYQIKRVNSIIDKLKYLQHELLAKNKTKDDPIMRHLEIARNELIKGIGRRLIK